ncbi:MAG: FliH/SctL family protein [Rhodothermaceae bacterium]
MSNVVRLKIKQKTIKARIPELDENTGVVSEEDSFKKELETSYQNGYNEGYEAARTELEKNFNQELVAKSEEFYNILSSFENKLIEYEESFGNIVIEVSHKIAEKIIKTELDHRSTIEETLKDGLKKVLGANEVIVKINPGDLEKLKSEGTDSGLAENFSRIKFETDANIMQGGCLIETEVGNVDARILTQVSEIVKQLKLKITEE